jgi:ketosteroid isomerase-like protein
MSLDENKAVVRRYFEEVWNQRNLAVLGELVAADIRDYGDVSVRDRPPGHAGVLAHYRGVMSAFLDFHLELEEFVAEGDTVVVFWVATGREAKTQQPFRARAISRLQVVGGKITEYRVLADFASVRQQVADGQEADARRVTWRPAEFEAKAAALQHP